MVSNLKGKRLLILGGNRISCEIVRKAKELGIYTMVTDWYPIDRSPAKQLADEYFMTSTADIPSMVKLIKDEKVDGVITGFTDSVLPYYADMCELAGLPHYGTREQFETLTNKNAYKKLCKQYGVPVVDEYHLTENDLHTDKVNQIKYPVLVKPADGSGARGVFICKDKDELINNYQKALRHSETKEIIVERFVEGKEVTVFYTLRDGEIYLSAMGNRHIKDNQKDTLALPVAYTFPSIYLKDYTRNVDPRVKEMFSSLGMKDGMVFMQCLIEDGECLVYDIGYRLTGSLEYKLLEEICGYNPLEMMINYALTGKMADFSLEEKANPFWDTYACNVSFLIKPGVIREIQGVDDILNTSKVIDAVLAHVEGDKLPESAKGTLRQIVLRAFATASTQEELEVKLNEIYEKLNVISDQGENMLLEGLDTGEMKGELI